MEILLDASEYCWAVEPKVNENLLADHFYEMAEQIPGFRNMGMDQQAEFVLDLMSQVDQVMMDYYHPNKILNGKF